MGKSWILYVAGGTFAVAAILWVASSTFRKWVASKLHVATSRTASTPTTPTTSTAQPTAVLAGLPPGVTGATVVTASSSSPGGVLIPQTTANQIAILTQDLANQRAFIAAFNANPLAFNNNGSLYPPADQNPMGLPYTYGTPLANVQHQLAQDIAQLQALGVSNP